MAHSSSSSSSSSLRLLAVVVAAVLCSAALLPLTSSASSSAPSPSSTLWRHVGRAPDLTVPIQLSIGVTQRNVATLLSTLHAVSTPSSPTYRQHLSFDALNHLMAPRRSAVSTIEQWLVAGGIPRASIHRTASGEWLSVHTTLAVAEALLSTEYHSYQHTSLDDVQILRCSSYALPDAVAAVVDVIGPTTRFPSYHSPRARQLPTLTPTQKRLSHLAHTPTSPTSADPCSPRSITPDCIRAAYSVGSANASSHLSSGAVNGFLEQYISTTDLDTFFTSYDKTQVGRRPSIVGPNDATKPGVEASLDIQYVMALAHGANLTFWYTPGRQPKSPENEPFLVWLTDLSNTTSPPLVISTSYGDDEPSVDLDYATRVNTEFAKAGARGISILFSSGDGGVSGGQSQRCTNFIATYPAGSPFVTAVGATRLLTGVPLNETSAAFSSGGFSDYWARPDWQKQAVSDYFTTYGHSFPNSSRYNQTGRGFPDVAAVGENFPIIVGGREFEVDGTSCSSPTFAALVVVLNDLLLSAGENALGFLNPLIYQHGAEAFNDVTTGNNPGCSTTGFYAASFWDPVTGWGTPVTQHTTTPRPAPSI